jgi:hypothetical protein
MDLGPEMSRIIAGVNGTVYFLTSYASHLLEVQSDAEQPSCPLAHRATWPKKVDDFHLYRYGRYIRRPSRSLYLGRKRQYRGTSHFGSLPIPIQHLVLDRLVGYDLALPG